VYRGDGPHDNELREMEQRIDCEGYVLCFSPVLDDYVAFHRDDVNPDSILSVFVPYSDRELRELFGDGKPDWSPKDLRSIHAWKKAGATVTGNEPEVPRQDD
jgi:hypothetical protein